MSDVQSLVQDRPDAAAQISSLIFGVLLLNEQGIVTQTNQAAEALLGQGANRMLNRPAADVVKLTDERVSKRMADTEEALVARNVGLHVSGHEKRVNLTISPMSGHPGWRVLTLSDAGRDDEGREDKRQVSSIGAPSILAHEIKNPLAAIRGAGQLVARKLNPEDVGLAKMITGEVDRIAGLIDRMQQLGSAHVDPTEPCNLHEAVRTAIATVRAADTKGIEFVEEFDPSLPPVQASRDALEQILINLLSNACEAACNAEEPVVVVKTRFVSGLAFSTVRSGKSVKLPIEVSVIDNGEGVDESMRDHVFEPFVTSKRSGQGLGLALVRKLVRDMDGRISHARDDDAALTHFKLHLPLADQGTGL